MKIKYKAKTTKSKNKKRNQDFGHFLRNKTNRNKLNKLKKISIFEK